MRRGRKKNPSAAATAGWALGGALATAGVVYFVLREVYTKQIMEACLSDLLGGLGGGQASIDPNALERRVRQML